MSISQTHAWMRIINQKIEEIATAMDSRLDEEQADISIERFMSLCKPLRKDRVCRKKYLTLRTIVDKHHQIWCKS